MSEHEFVVVDYLSVFCVLRSGAYTTREVNIK